MPSAEPRIVDWTVQIRANVRIEEYDLDLVVTLGREEVDEVRTRWAVAGVELAANSQPIRAEMLRRLPLSRIESMIGIEAHGHGIK